MDTRYSVRTSLQGAMTDFLKASGFGSCAESSRVIHELTALLASYREEGVPLFPSVYVLDEYQRLAEIAPGTKPIVVSTGCAESISSSKILKDCASLAEGGWAIFVAKLARNEMSYGLFRSQDHSLAQGADEKLVNGTNGGMSAVRLRNRGHLEVEICNANGIVFTASFKTDQAADSPFVAHIDMLAKVLSDGLDSDAFDRYIKRVLAAVIQRSHGTLCVVLDVQDSDKPPPGFENSVWLPQPIDWYGAFSAAELTQAKISDLAHVQAVESLVAGMVNSDGVVVFGKCGRLLGYRAFVSPFDTESFKVPHEGGGRRRTYALLKSRLGREIRAVFFRSQDGATACDEV